MPYITHTSVKQIERQSNAVRKLQENCENCKLLRDKSPKDMYILEIVGNYVTGDGPAMIAIASYDESVYAVHAPEYLTADQFCVFEFLLRDVKPNSVIVVFSKESYEAVKKYSYRKPFDVKLYV